MLCETLVCIGAGSKQIFFCVRDLVPLTQQSVVWASFPFPIQITPTAQYVFESASSSYVFAFTQ